MLAVTRLVLLYQIMYHYCGQNRKGRTYSPDLITILFHRSRRAATTEQVRHAEISAAEKTDAEKVNAIQHTAGKQHSPAATERYHVYSDGSSECRYDQQELPRTRSGSAVSVNEDPPRDCSQTECEIQPPCVVRNIVSYLGRLVRAN